MVEMLSLNELCDEMRNRGMRVTNTIIAFGIEQGYFPFAFCIKDDSFEVRRSFFIFKKLFNMWMDERDMSL